jgi:hypothetical protein
VSSPLINTTFVSGYIPTQIQAGQTNGTIFRGENLWVRQGGRLENFKGLLDLGEDIFDAGTSGTVKLTAGSRTVTGSILPDPPSDFVFDYVQGSRFLIDGQLFVVGAVLSPSTMIITNAPTESLTGAATLPFLLVPIDTDRGAIISGSAQFYRDGIILATGRGPFYYNGGPGPLGLFNFNSQLHVHGVAVGAGDFQAGLSTAPELVAAGGSVTPTGGGTKNMIAGTYSLKLGRRRNQTKHVSNAGPVTYFTLTAGQRISVVYPPVDHTQGQDSWVLYVSKQGSTVDQTNVLGKNGPWFAIDIQPNGLSPSAPFFYEWANAELEGAAIAEFDADVPPHASFFAVISDTVVLESCHGNNAANPGPFIRAARVRNPEAFPPQALSEVTPPEPIIGVLEGVGRLYLLTQNALHIATLTGIDDAPLTTRPYWKTGFAHQNSAAFINGTIYGFSGGTPTRSRDEGEPGTEEHEFAARVRDIVASWRPERVFVGHDPINRAVVFIHANDQRRNGHWVSVALCYMLETDTWSTPMILENAIADLTVTGLCTAGGKLYLIASGKTYQWDTNDGSTTISGYLAPPFMDGGQPGFYKTITKVELIARLQTGSIGLFRNNDYEGLIGSTSLAPTGAHNISLFSGSPEDLLLESGGPSDTILLESSLDNIGSEGTGLSALDVNIYPWWKTNLRLAKTVSARIEWSWPGNGPLVSIDELTLHGEITPIAYQ